MRVARLEITRFRGFQSFLLVPRDNVVIVGEPRAGRSDLIDALRRILDPRSTQARPSEWDVYRPLPEPAVAEAGSDAALPLTSIEVSLLDLSSEIEQDLDERLELLDPESGEVAGSGESDDAELGIRLTYYLRYDQDEQQLEHWLEYPKTGRRVPRIEREALRGFVLEHKPPLQLRAEGALRRLASEPDPDTLADTLETFADRIAGATTALAESDEVQAALRIVVDHGPRRLFELDEDEPTAGIGFTAEDGSMAALLRAVHRPWTSTPGRAPFRWRPMDRRRRPCWRPPRPVLPPELTRPSSSPMISAISSTLLPPSTSPPGLVAAAASCG